MVATKKTVATTKTPLKRAIPNRKKAQPLVGSDRILLKEQAYEQIKRLIQAGDFPANSSLSERQLASQLSMSKTPIRAALEKLETQGLVTVSPQKGILVLDLSAREIGELFDLRLAVEPFAAGKLASRSWTQSQRSRLEQNLKGQKVAAKSEDVSAATELDIEFHRLLAEVLDNREIMSCLEKCFDKLHRSILHINRQVPGRLGKSCSDHIAIVGMILKGNSVGAVAAMEDHVSYGRRFLLGGE